MNYMNKTHEPINARDYIVKNYKQYNIDGVNSEKDMIELLNILQAHDETLDSMHDFIGDCYGSFCEIMMSNPDTMGDILVGLQEYNLFYASFDELSAIIQEMIDEDPEPLYKTVSEYIEESNDDFYKTADGYIRVLHY